MEKSLIISWVTSAMSFAGWHNLKSHYSVHHISLLNNDEATFHSFNIGDFLKIFS